MNIRAHIDDMKTRTQGVWGIRFNASGVATECFEVTAVNGDKTTINILSGGTLDVKESRIVDTQDLLEESLRFTRRDEFVSESRFWTHPLLEVFNEDFVRDEPHYRSEPFDDLEDW